jgi:HKD family nuclease
MKAQIHRINLHDALKQPRFNHAVILTYTFSPRFFEDYCLERFNCLKENGNVSILLDRGIYDRLLVSGSGTDPGDFPSKGNVRYLLHPISVPGTFHPKLFLFASKKKGLLVIGSANFTRDGIASNAELVNCYEFSLEEDEQHRPLFCQAVQYLQKLGQMFPSKHLDSNLNALIAEAQWLVETEPQAQGDLPILLHNLEAPLWDQLTSGIKRPVECVHVLSRYFDSSPALLDEVRTSLQPRKIKIYTQNAITTMTRAWFEHPLFRDGTVEVYACRYEDGDHPQQLHGKAIIIEDPAALHLAFGSANFTNSALRRNAAAGNIELLLHFAGLPKRTLQIERFFDPAQTAIRLRAPEDLQTAEPEESADASPSFPIRLCEAWVQDDKLVFRAEIPVELSGTSVKGQVYTPKRKFTTIEFDQLPSGDYRGSIPDDLESQLRSTGNTLQVFSEQGGRRAAESNPVLIANLQDIWTGRNLRRERHIQEALQSAGRFISVLNELSGNEDEEALLKFLTYCDIPIISTLRGMRPPSQPRSGMFSHAEMRDLGDRNLRVFNSLHQAVIHFVERHKRRLERHAAGGTAQGIPNFMHILLANAGLLHSQIQRACYGFEAQEKPLTPDEWFQFRSRLEQYFALFLDLFRLFAQEYVPAVLKYSAVKKVKEAFGGDIQMLAELQQEIVQARKIIDELRTRRLRIQGPAYDPIVPPYFNSVMADAKWSGYMREIHSLDGQLHRAVA